jgi:predicted RNase H-like HicB family nuclease
MKGMKYTAILEKGQESGYIAYVPVLRGCVSQGQKRGAALENLKEAMQLYIEALLEDRLPIPTEVGKEAVEIGEEDAVSWSLPSTGQREPCERRVP